MNTRFRLTRFYAFICAHTLFVILPLILAISIYAIFRPYPPDNLVPFLKWLSPPRLYLNSDFDWLVYNVPDGLWAFSFTSFLIIHTRSDSSRVRWLCVSTGLTTMILLELMQIHWVAGRFDFLDITAILLGFLCSLLLLRTLKGMKCLSTL